MLRFRFGGGQICSPGETRLDVGVGYWKVGALRGVGHGFSVCAAPFCFNGVPILELESDRGQRSDREYGGC
jgi:hypothetical protein